MEKTRIAADSVVEALGIGDSVRRVHIETTETPWKEKVLVEEKKEHLDVKLLVWEDNLFLYGRVYRLLLYVYDTLDPAFGYGAERVPEKQREPSVRKLYTHIWSIYVDSRMEKMGIANFYDRTVRRNLFIDARADLSWGEASAVFDNLWSKGTYSHEDIVSYARNLDRVLISTKDSGGRAIETQLGDLLKEHSVPKHLNRLSSTSLRDTANRILNFITYGCKGTTIRSSYYGIRFEFEKRVIGEMLPMGDRILLTLMDNSHKLDTIAITESSEADVFQNAIRDTLRTYPDFRIS